MDAKNLLIFCLLTAIVYVTIKFSLPICPTLTYIVYIVSNIKLLVLTCRVSGMILLFRMAAVKLPMAALLILLIIDHQQQYSELKRGKCQLLYHMC